MRYQRTYLDKCATIVKGSDVNTGFNPVGDIFWGRNVSRFLLHFDHNKIKSMVEDKIFPDINKLHHTLKITNAGSLDLSELHKVYGSQVDGEKKRRASSFDLVYFLIPTEWDGGKGYDYMKNYFDREYSDKKSYDYDLYIQKEGVNWYNCKQGVTWKSSIGYKRTTTELFDFFVKASTNKIGCKGGDITFRFYCKCNGNYANQNLEFKAHNPLPLHTPEIGSLIHFAKNNQICYTPEHIAKYSQYIEVNVHFDENKKEEELRHQFNVVLKVGDKTFKSNLYQIIQESALSKSYPVQANGIYTSETLNEELEKYYNGEDSIVIGTQHFDIGNENIELDITDTFNKFISGQYENYGIGIAFAPWFEESTSDYENYIGLFTNKTNSFFEPYVETIYEDVIKDDRTKFIVGNTNKLYLYSTIGGKLENLDKLPSCIINDTNYEVKQATKGIYYVEVSYPFSAYTNPTMLYDSWYDLQYQGMELPSVELDFTTTSPYTFFNIGTNLPNQETLTPTVYGVKNNEKIKRGDLRKIGVLIKKSYTENKAVDFDDMEMRLYVMDGKVECDVIPYMKLDKAFNENYFELDTSILIPNTYYIDIKMNYGMQNIVHHEVAKFVIVDDSKNMFE